MTSARRRGWLGGYSHPRLIRRWQTCDVFACEDADGQLRLAVVTPESDPDGVARRLAEVHTDPPAPIFCELVDDLVQGEVRLLVFDFRPVADLTQVWRLPDLMLSVSAGLALCETVAEALQAARELIEVRFPQLTWASLFTDRQGHLGWLALPQSPLHSARKVPAPVFRGGSPAQVMWHLFGGMRPVFDLHALHPDDDVPGPHDSVSGALLRWRRQWRARGFAPDAGKAGDELAAAAERYLLRSGIQPVDLPRALAGRYLIERTISTSGSGTVALAHDRITKVRVAIKSLAAAAPKRRRERFRREARILCDVSHPSLLRGFDLLDVDGRLHAVMEFVEGPSLRRWLIHVRPSARQVVARIAEVAQGLAALHTSGIVHGDVKPSNIVVDPQRGAVLVDYGVARRTGGIGMGTEVPVTAAGDTPLGTPRYLAPEVAAEQLSTTASDIYALGMTLLEGLGGVQRSLAPGAIDPIVASRGVDMPQELRATLEAALAVDPAERPPAALLAAKLGVQALLLPEDSSGARAAESTADVVVPVVVVSRVDRRIRLPNQELIDLHDRPVIWRIFEALWGSREARPRQFLEVGALVAAVWPDREGAQWERNRVYASVAKLQRDGLGALLQSDDRGFRLAPQVEFVADD